MLPLLLFGIWPNNKTLIKNLYSLFDFVSILVHSVHEKAL